MEAQDSAVASRPARGETDQIQRTYVVVPENPSAEMHYLKRDRSLHLGRQAPDAIIARLPNGRVVLAACLDDPMCGTGHCGNVDTDGAYTGARIIR